MSDVRDGSCPVFSVCRAALTAPVLLRFRALVSRDPAGTTARLRAATPDGRCPCRCLPLPPLRPRCVNARGRSLPTEEEANL